jgi:hypothetical protein
MSWACYEPKQYPDALSLSEVMGHYPDRRPQGSSHEQANTTADAKMKIEPSGQRRAGGEQLTDSVFGSGHDDGQIACEVPELVQAI